MSIDVDFIDKDELEDLIFVAVGENNIPLLDLLIKSANRTSPARPQKIKIDPHCLLNYAYDNKNYEIYLWILHNFWDSLDDPNYYTIQIVLALT